jgi:hypothetical protein
MVPFWGLKSHFLDHPFVESPRALGRSFLRYNSVRRVASNRYFGLRTYHWSGFERPCTAYIFDGSRHSSGSDFMY